MRGCGSRDPTGDLAKAFDGTLSGGKLELGTIRRLVRAGADVNTRRKYDGLTLLTWATPGDDYGLLQELIDRGADVNGGDRRGFTPLMSAAAYNRPAAAQLLLGNGAKPGLKDAYGRTALQLATRHRSTGVVALLKPKGAR